MPRLSMIDRKNNDVKIDRLDFEFDDNDFVIDMLVKAKYKGYIVVIDYNDKV